MDRNNQGPSGIKGNRLSIILILLGMLLFGWQLWVYAHHQTTFIDEGMYQYLGFQFTSGNKFDYGDSGAWNYYAPLSFLFPGVIQSVFGPGIAVGRYFSIVCALLTCLALSLLSNRLGGRWWSVAVVWAMALTPMQIKMYSLGLSQALSACLLGWTMVLVIGKKRTWWQVFIGSLLAGMTVMTRHNLIPLLPLLIGYIFWQHGKKKGFWSLLGCTTPVLLGTGIYWPSSLRLWSLYWLPRQWLPSLIDLGSPVGSTPAWNMHVEINSQIRSFFMGFRAHFIALTGAFASLILWPRKGSDSFERKTAVFLALLFFSLFVLHAWASLGYGQCTYCFAPYTAFFSNLALILVVITFPRWNKKPSIILQVGIVLFLIIISQIPAFIDGEGDRLLALPVPRINDGIKIGEWTTLWSYVSSLFTFDYTLARSLLPPIFYLLVGLINIGMSFGIYRLILKRLPGFQYSFLSFVLVICLLIGFVLTPLMNGEYRENGSCDKDVLANYTQVGSELASSIQSGGHLYWDVESAVFLLFLPSVEIHPAQVYGIYSYRIGGDASAVARSGYWNAELASMWMEEADYLVIEAGREIVGPKVEDILNLDLYTITTSSPVNPCIPGSQLMIYQKNP